jgi:hypothetical protein
MLRNHLFPHRHLRAVTQKRALFEGAYVRPGGDTCCAFQAGGRSRRRFKQLILSIATFLADGGYLARGVRLINRIHALTGQVVCSTSLIIIIDGVEAGAAHEYDHLGR